MHKDVEKALSSAGNDIIIKVLSMISNINNEGYTPKHLIISEGFNELLYHASNLQGCHCFDKGGVNKLLGLEVHLTEIEGTLEVY